MIEKYCVMASEKLYQNRGYDVNKFLGSRFIKVVTVAFLYVASSHVGYRPTGPEAQGGSGGMLPQNIFEKENPISVFSCLLTHEKGVC